MVSRAVYRLSCYNPASFIQLRFCCFFLIFFLSFCISLNCFKCLLSAFILTWLYVEVSWNRGTPKSSIEMGFPMITKSIFGIPHLWKPPYPAMIAFSSSYTTYFWHTHYDSLHCGFLYTWVTCSSTLSGNPSSSSPKGYCEAGDDSPCSTQNKKDHGSTSFCWDPLMCNRLTSTFKYQP